MPRNGSGTYTLPEPPFVAGSVISSAAVNDDFNDIASALTGSLPRDGQAGMTGQFKAIDGSVGAPSISFNNEASSGFFRVSAGVIGIAISGTQVATIGSSGIKGTLPIGMLADFAGTTAPSLWLLCFGQLVSRTTYAALFAVIGTTYGAGDGVTTFALPDLRGVVLVGKADMGGSATGKLTSLGYGNSPIVLGNFGGAQVYQIVLANLPPYTPTGSVTGTASVLNNDLSLVNGVAPTSLQGGSGGFGWNNVPVTKNLTSTGGITASFAGSPQGGTQTAFGLVQPSIIINKIIYAGV